MTLEYDMEDAHRVKVTHASGHEVVCDSHAAMQ